MILTLSSKSFIPLPSLPSGKWERTEKSGTGRPRLSLLPIRTKAVSKMKSALKQCVKDYTKNVVMLQVEEKWQETASWKS